MTLDELFESLQDEQSLYQPLDMKKVKCQRCPQTFWVFSDMEGPFTCLPECPRLLPPSIEDKDE